LFAESHSILTRWRIHFSQLLTVRWVNDIRQTEIHTAEPLVPEPSACGVEVAIEKLKVNKSPGIDQIPAKLIKAEGRTIRSEILFWIRKNCRKCGMGRSFYLFIRRAIKEFEVIIDISLFPTVYKT